MHHTHRVTHDGYDCPEQRGVRTLGEESALKLDSSEEVTILVMHLLLSDVTMLTGLCSMIPPMT